MKKTLALVLALAMVFSTITVAFAEGTLGEDAQICADLGMLKGETGTVDAAYVATAPTRLQAAVMFLRLKGLEAEALAFTGEDNFADGNIAWAEGANLLAYLKANPQLGWIGDGTNFNPNKAITAQEYYKVLLEALGYKQTTAEVAGDFTWEEVLTFAASVGLSKVANVENFTVNDLAVATVEALKANVKGTEEALYKSLVTEEAAVAAGLVEGEAAPVAVEAEIDEVLAIGNKVVQVVFEDDVDAAAAGDIDNYAIAGVTIEDVVVAGSNVVRLYTDALTAGKLYTLTMGEQSVKFAGVAKVSDGPQITDVESEDVEEVVVMFDRNVDFATATDVANYEIKGVTIVSAEIDPDEPDEVILTTEGLKDDTKYTVKVTNIKSVDLVNRKSNSEEFKTNFDKVAPKINDAYADTNERVIVEFNEKVTKESAEDIANYVIKVDKTDGEELEILSIEWDDDDEDNVEIITEPMDKKAKKYKITISNIADQRKAGNVMTRAYSKSFEPKDVDDKAPSKLSTSDIRVLSPTQFTVTFKDKSRLDQDSILDISNYELEQDDSALDIESIEKYKTKYTNDPKEFIALFTVEEMSTKTCELSYTDIMDEFGNALGDEKVTFKPQLGHFASAVLQSAEATGENTIILTFDSNFKNVDKDSAENIANYTIDEGIGTPTKAEFEYKVSGVKQAYKVRLTVADLIAGKDYELTIDGLLDEAGNELKIEDYDITNNGTWGDPVELDGAEAISKYVVALSFDQEVTYAAGAKVIMTADDTSTTGVELFAKAMGEDDEVVEFSDYGNDELDPSVTTTWYVYHIEGVTDLAGDPIVFEPYEYTVSVSENDKPEYAEFESIEQIDADTVKIVMSRNVKYAGSGAPAGWTVTTDTTNGTDPDETVYLRRTTGADIEKKLYEFNLYQFLVDEHGIPVVDDEDVDYEDDPAQPDYLAPIAGKTEFEGDKADTTKPNIDKVVALSRLYVEVTFDEYLDKAVVDALNANTDIKIVNLDDDDDQISIASITLNDAFEGDVIEITLSEPLEARYEYELRIAGNKIADFAGNKADADTYSFEGTNLSQH